MTNRPEIDADDICSLEASDRTNFWDLTLWHPTEERKVVIDTYHQRDRQRAADMASLIAETVRAWISAEDDCTTRDQEVSP